MSSTNRGADRSPGDFYRTPSWCVELIAPHLALEGFFDLVVDPGCGDGAIRQGLRGAGWEARARFVGVETHPVLAERARATDLYNKVIEADFCNTAWLDDVWLEGGRERTPERTLVIGNPPYSNAMRFVETSMMVGDTVAMLLRLPWMASLKRAAFHRANPSDVYVLPKRSFNGRGCDSCDYAWFVWGAGPRGRWQVL